MAALICPYAAVCGGCDAQDVPYADQVATKDAWLRGLFESRAWQPFVASPGEHPAYYRNKIRFAFTRENGNVRPSRHGKDGFELGVDLCLLQSPLSNEIVNFTAQYAQDHGWTLYDPSGGTGWLKHLLIREGKRTGEVMLNLVTNQEEPTQESAWVRAVNERFPRVLSLYHTRSWGRSNETTEERLVWGSPYIHETVGANRFRISPQAFFQTNSDMVETLYDLIGETADLSPEDTLWDLYAGSATIGIHLSHQAGSVVSIENNPQNGDDARANIRENAVRNLTFIEGTVEDALSGQTEPDVIVVDPPRAGLSPEVRQQLVVAGARRIVYVSCNPLTCLRDTRHLTAGGYAVTRLQGIDMFPHTRHCEMIVCLDRTAS